MIETEQTITIGAPLESVWAYVETIPNWANFMPGLQNFAVIDANDSRWTLKVGVGGMLRTVNVAVHVNEWAGPQRAVFSYALEGDPVLGGGSYKAARIAADQTEVTLNIRVEGSGPMAAMWEAMGRPLLPVFVKAFAGQLKAQIEAAGGTASEEAAPPKPSRLASLWRWLQSCLPRADPRS
jgi:carbon monoxide dehydrogenase subunit G